MLILAVVRKFWTWASSWKDKGLGHHLTLGREIVASVTSLNVRLVVKVAEWGAGCW